MKKKLLIAIPALVLCALIFSFHSMAMDVDNNKNGVHIRIGTHVIGCGGVGSDCVWVP